jgi:glutathione S-transferase
MIYDRSTGTGIADSFKIAQYLDTTYPNTPRLIPDGTHGLLSAFGEAVMTHIAPLFKFNRPKAHSHLNETSAAYFKRTREARDGKTFEDLFPKGEQAEVEWKKLEAGWDNIAKWYKAGDKFIAGDAPIFADFQLAAYFFWTKRVWGEDSVEYKRMLNFSGGKWAKLMQTVHQYERV